MKLRKRVAGGESGAGLIMAILLSLLLTAIGTTMIISANTEQLIAGNERDAERALFASKAGLAYGFQLYADSAVIPTTPGAAFTSGTVSTPLDGASFSGTITDLSSVMLSGALYKILSTGVYNQARRTTELVFQQVPDASKYGYMAFSAVTLHNHSGLSGPWFKIKSTIYSNGSVSVPPSLTIDGSIVAATNVTTSAGSTITGSVFANSVTNAGTIKGIARTLTAVTAEPSTFATPNRVDAYGNKYIWFSGLSTPGAISGTAALLGNSTHTIATGEVFNYSIFNKDGTLNLTPDLNVIASVAPPMLDYVGMHDEAHTNAPARGGDDTFFTTPAALYTYLSSKKVTETVGGKTVTTIKVGTAAIPQFIYVEGAVAITLNPTAGSDSGGTFKAHGLQIEGGIYASNGITLNGATQAEFTSTVGGYPTGYNTISINGLPYCLPAVIAYPEPATGYNPAWKPTDTPVISSIAKGTGDFSMSSKSAEGFALLNGLTYSGGQTHLHHTQSAQELITFNGAELGSVLHNCDFMAFTYIPDVRCTRFLISNGGTPQIVSYREIR